MNGGALRLFFFSCFPFDCSPCHSILSRDLRLGFLQKLQHLLTSYFSFLSCTVFSLRGYAWVCILFLNTCLVSGFGHFIHHPIMKPTVVFSKAYWLLKSRYKFVSAAFIILLLLQILLSHSDHLHSKPGKKVQTHYDSKSKGERSKVIESMLSTIADYNPKIGFLDKYKNDQKAKQKFATDDDFYFSEFYLSNILELSRADELKLKAKHSGYVEEIKKSDITVFGPSDTKRISGHGVVIVGGGQFSWLALVSINQLRLTGSKIPVEVFIASKEDYDSEFCEEVLPQLEAKCVLGFKEFPKMINKLSISGFQYKLLAILMSSFEHVLLLDADNVVLAAPDKLFTMEEYQKYGLVVWPDCWSRTTTPAFYDIAGIEVNRDKPVRGIFKENKLSTEWNFHDLEGALPNPSSESGMVLVNKKQQVKTLMLALYYNVYGPGCYYPLLTQGGAGEGDKDTFIAASYALDKNIYQVKQGMSFFGYFDDGFNAKALGQWDPSMPREKDKSLPGNVLFMHLSYPKLYVSELHNELINKDGQQRRLYQDTDPNKLYDFELRIFEIMTQLVCKGYDADRPNGYTEIPTRLGGLSLSVLKHLELEKDANTEEFCKDDLLPHLEYLRKTTDEFIDKIQKNSK